MIASSLFHFTSKLDTLKLILESKRLRASYNIENIENLIPNERFIAIPMVCFCDIPLKFITKSLTDRYGYIGLGFKKEWGIANKINPIFYRHKESILETNFLKLTKELNLLLGQIDRTKLLEIDKYNIYIENMIQKIGSAKTYGTKIAGFIKPYQEMIGNIYWDNYIDREWRWVPEISQSHFVPEKSDKIRKEINTQYFQNPDHIKFKFDDLNYLIVEKRSDVKRAIKLVSSLNIDISEKEILIQKIIDIESINLDM